MASERWQYDVESIKSEFFTGSINTEAMRKVMNERGALGWELVQILSPGAQKFSTTHLMVFKRRA